MIWDNSDLPYDICNTINDDNQRQTYYRSSIFQIILVSIKERFKKFFSNFICFVFNHDFFSITF